jgi:hypothetical protein
MNEIIQVVFKKGVLFDVNISRWSALHQMQTGDLLLEKLNRKIVYPGHKKLLPEEASYPLIHLEGKIRSHVRKNSMDFPVSGAVYVNFKALPKMLKELKKLRAEYEAAAQVLYDNWESIKTKQIDALNEESRKIAVQNGLYEPTTPAGDREILKKWLSDQQKRHAELYPKKEDLLAKYAVSWTMFRVDALGDSVASLIDETDAAMIMAHQEKLQKDMQMWVKTKAAEMHQVIGEAALKAKDLLAENGKLNPKNLKPLFAAFEQFKAVDFAGSSFEQVIEDIEKKFLVSDPNGELDFKAVAEGVNNNTDAFSQLLSEVSQLAVEDVAQKAGAVALSGSDFKRVVEI